MAAATNTIPMVDISLPNSKIESGSEPTIIKKRALETELDTNSIEKKIKIEEIKPVLMYRLTNPSKPNWSHSVYSSSLLVKNIKNTYFLEKLKVFIKEYINRNGILKNDYKGTKISQFSPEFLLLVSNYRMAYYTDTKTDNELFIEFTNIEGVIKYGKLD